MKLLKFLGKPLAKFFLMFAMRNKLRIWTPKFMYLITDRNLFHIFLCTVFAFGFQIEKIKALCCFVIAMRSVFVISKRQFYCKTSVLALYFCWISSNFGSFSIFLFAFSLWAVKKKWNGFEVKSFTKCFGLSYCLFAMALNQVRKWENAFGSLSETRNADCCVWTTGALLAFAGGRHFILIISKALGA